MKIAFDASTLIGIDSKTPARSGIFFCSFSLIKEFKKHHQVILYTDHRSWASIKFSSFFRDYEILKPKNPIAKLVSYAYLLRSKLDPYRKYWVIKLLCKSITFSVLCAGKMLRVEQNIQKQLGIDAFFSAHSCFEMDFFPETQKFVLLHDAIPVVCPEHCLDSVCFFFRTQISDLLNQKDNYFANSHYTKSDFLKLFPHKLDGNKIKVTHLGASENFYHDFNEAKNQNIREKYNIPKDKKYIFSLCTLEPRKNLLFVVENFLEMIERERIEDVVFVLGGGYRDSFMGKMEKMMQKSRNKILHIGYVDDEDLSNLFSHSLCSVYLSLYEGFGLPVLESMQCGCPVIASNTTSIPEIVGDSGILIDPKDGKALQEWLMKIYRDPRLREELAQKGLEQAKQFSWEKCAREMLEYMEEVVSKEKK